MTDQPNHTPPPDLPEPVPVHFDWAPDAIKDKMVPVCKNRGVITRNLNEVTCPQCADGIVEVVSVWCRRIPPDR